MQEELKGLIEPVVEGLGFELWGLEYRAHGKSASLKVYIDAESGIDVDDCARVSRQVSAMLDVEDPISVQYTLEVSSPGMDRRLFTKEQFRAFEGSNVKVALRAPFEGRRRFTGLLCGMEDDDVVVRSGDEEYLLPFEEIDRANVVPSFE
ncbi:MAG TPA: ribosome maturation factor RimP [Pseudomonadales bacterium]|nr:ribosome maturation factor RimP [Pseudomonadales bacterium]